MAGLTLAAIGIPEVMGYTKIAGMPVVTGLYTLVVPIALFALFGSSRHLVVGADSATAAILAGELKERGARLVFAEVDPKVRKELDAAGVTAALGADAFYPSVNDAVAAYGA